MQDCPVCGREFDPLAFQVIVPELERGFDRIECARIARGRAASVGALATAPLLPVDEPFAVTSAETARAFPLHPLVAAPLVTIGLLAAGTAAAAYLWVGVLGADVTRFPVTGLNAPAAFGHETVRAHVPPAPDGVAGTATSNHSTRPAPDRADGVLAAGNLAATPAAHSGANPAGGQRPSAGSFVRLRPRSSPASSSDSEESGKGHKKHGKGHAKHGRAHGKGHAKHGKGHLKHGETTGIHTPGHGGHGKHGAHGHGKKKGH